MPAKSVAFVMNVRVPVGTPLKVFDHVPLLAATVPRETPFSNTSIVVPGSAVPVSVNMLPVLVMGAVMTGAAGACVSTWIRRIAELGDVPPTVRACAQLSAGTAQALAKDEGEPCAEAARGLDLSVEAVTGAYVFGVSAKVDLAGGESAFLELTPAGWRVAAAGCQPSPGEQPYDCEVEA